MPLNNENRKMVAHFPVDINTFSKVILIKKLTEQMYGKKTIN